MKKLLISAMALFATMTLSAQVTADVTLRLESESGSTCDLYLFAGPDLGVTPERGSFFANASNPEDVNIYAVDPSTSNKYSSYGDAVLTSIPLGIITSKEAESKQNYTIHFTVDVSTETLKLVDLVACTVTDITNGGHYDFSVTSANAPAFVEGTYSTIADRFVINFPVATGNLETCFTGEELQITNNPFLGKVIITNNSTSAVHEYAYKASDTIDMSEPGEYPDGDYTVQVGSGVNIRKFIVTVKH